MTVVQVFEVSGSRDSLVHTNATAEKLNQRSHPSMAWFFLRLIPSYAHYHCHNRRDAAATSIHHHNVLLVGVRAEKRCFSSSHALTKSQTRSEAQKEDTHLPWVAAHWTTAEMVVPAQSHNGHSAPVSTGMVSLPIERIEKCQSLSNDDRKITRTDEIMERTSMAAIWKLSKIPIWSRRKPSDLRISLPSPSPHSSPGPLGIHGASIRLKTRR